MNIFAIMGHDDNPKLAEALAAHFPNDHLRIGQGQWLVASRGTTVDVSNTLGITGGESGSAIVASISSYYGRASTNIWAWIKVKIGTP